MKLALKIESTHGSIGGIPMMTSRDAFLALTPALEEGARGASPGIDARDAYHEDGDTRDRSGAAALSSGNITHGIVSPEIPVVAAASSARLVGLSIRRYRLGNTSRFDRRRGRSIRMRTFPT